MKYKILLVLSFLWVNVEILAQQDAQFSQYMFSKMYINPATAGLDTANINMGAGYRSQWVGYTATFDDGGAPNTTMLYFSMPIRAFGTRQGVGLHFVNDQLGPLTNIELMLSYAYHYEFRDGILSVGLRGGFYNQVVDFSKFRWNDDNDPLLTSLGRENQYRPDFALGANVQWKKWHLGIAFNHLGESSFKYANEITLNSLQNHFTATGGVDIDLSPSVTLMPSAIMRSDWNTFSYQGTLLSRIKETYYIGASLRNSNAIDDLIVMIGFNLLKNKNLSFNYAFDYVLSGRETKAGSSHELMIGYRIPNVQKAVRNIIRTPRFRY